MKTLFKLICLAVLIGGLSPANAASYEFDLDCHETGSSACTVTGDTWGTVTIADVVANTVNITVSLIGDTLKFSDLVLNFEQGSAIDKLTDQDSNEYLITQNLITLNPWKTKFDTSIGDNIPNNHTFTLTGNGGIGEPLKADHFLYKSKLYDPNLYLALHIQSCGTSPSTPYCDPNDGSVKVGATDYKEKTPGIVPIPAAVWLFGSGLIGMIGLGQRRRTTL